MKKSVLCLTFLLCSLVSYAQLSVGAGFANNMHRFSSSDNTFLNGFYIGGSYDLEFGIEGFMMTPGVYLSIVAKNIDEGESDYILSSPDSKWTEQYVNIPVRFSYGDDISQDIKLFGYAGPVASVGIHSKYSSTEMYDDYYKRFDLKFGIGVGIDIRYTVRVTAGYDFGLLDRSKTSGETLRTNVFHIGAGYIF